MERSNYYKEDEFLVWLGSRAFYGDEYYGRALTNEELEERVKLEEEYIEEINIAEAMLKANPSFEKLSIENRINLATSLILELKEISSKEKKTK